jgi:hypothetical protein
MSTIILLITIINVTNRGGATVPGGRVQWGDKMNLLFLSKAKLHGIQAHHPRHMQYSARKIKLFTYYLATH